MADTLPIFVINLDRRPDRLARISADLAGLGLAWTRVPAIDAQDPPAQGQRHRAILDHWSQIRVLDPGSIACAMSHRLAMRTFLTETDADAALFLEDDAELSVDIPSFVRSVDWWPCGASLIKLEAWGWKPRYDIYGRPVGARYHGREFRPISLWTPGGGAYLLNRGAAEIVLAETSTVNMPIDTLLFDLRVSRVARALRPLQVVPGLATQCADEVASDLQTIRKNAPRLAGWRRFRRALHLIPYKASINARRCVGRVGWVDLRFVDFVKDRGSN